MQVSSVVVNSLRHFNIHKTAKKLTYYSASAAGFKPRCLMIDTFMCVL